MPRPDAWVLVAPDGAPAAVEPLLAAHRSRRPVRVLDALPGPAELRDAAGVLVLGDRRRAPRTVLPGPFLVDDAGRRVPAGWCPRVDDDGLARFARAAAAVHAREGSVGPVAFLGQWDAPVERMVARSLRILARQGSTVPTLWWTADRIVRRDLLTALRLGLGCALYFGHGRPYGWQGYHGLHTRHLVHARGRPTGAILSLTCRTASRWRVGLSFAESLILEGVCAASLGAVAPTRTVDNWWWATSLEERLSEDPGQTLGAWVIAACPPRPEQWAAYRIIGDPLVPLVGADGAAEAAAAVWAPAPDDDPCPPGYLAELDA